MGVLAWWLIGLVAYLSAPKSAKASPTHTPIQQQQSASASGSSTVTQNQAGRDINQAGRDIVINNLGPAETLPGTDVTERQVREAFPFGYVIFSQRDGKWTYSPLPSDKMQFSGDWNRVTIGVDFEHRVVRWSIPDINSTNTGIQVISGRAVQDIPLDTTNIYALRFILIEGQPILCMATLSEDQRFPVFVLGARILSHEEAAAGQFRASWRR